MKTSKFFTVIGVTTLLVLALVVTGWFITTAFAQGPWQGGNWGAMHNNQAVPTLLKTNESDLLKERQAGKSWLDIATAKGVSEQALTDALLQPMTQMHAWMSQNYPESNIERMTDWMREQFAQAIRVTEYGTMIDMQLFGGSMINGGMMDGSGMMGNGNGSNGFGGMMSGGMMGGMMNGNGMMGGGMMSGMMNGWDNTTNVNATPVPSTQKVDREIQLNTSNFKFEPSEIHVKPGETVKFTITNQDKFAHNAVSQNGNLAYTVLPPNQTTSILWVAPTHAGTYTVICTWHPGMQFTVVVE